MSKTVVDLKIFATEIMKILKVQKSAQKNWGLHIFLLKL